VGRGIPVFASGTAVPFRLVATDEKGQFSFEGLAPGQYHVFAMDGPAMPPPESVLKIVTQVTVAEGATSINLKLTTPDDLKAAASAPPLDQ
jgi:hypothetical protein